MNQDTLSINFKQSNFLSSWRIMTDEYNSQEHFNKIILSNVQKLSSMLTAYWQTQTLYIASKLGVFDAIKKGFRTISTLSEELDIKPKYTLLLIRALLALETVDYDGTNLELKPLGELLTEEHPYSMKPAANVWAEEHYYTWTHLSEALKTGEEQFSTLYGSPFFTWVTKEKKHADTYQKAMEVYARIDYIDSMELLQFENNTIIMDVGGGYGILASLIAKKYSSSTVIVFDLPEVINQLKNKTSKIEKNIHFISGDFFSDNLPHCDTLILSRVLHDWKDSLAVEILLRCYKSLPKGGKIYIIEHVLPMDLQDTWGALLNLNMLVVTGGKERTLDEYKNLLQKVGFTYLTIETTKNTGISIISAYK